MARLHPSFLRAINAARREYAVYVRGPAEPEELYITSSGTRITFYKRPSGQLKIMSDPDFKQIIEYFAS